MTSHGKDGVVFLEIPDRAVRSLARSEKFSPGICVGIWIGLAAIGWVIFGYAVAPWVLS